MAFECLKTFSLFLEIFNKGKFMNNFRWLTFSVPFFLAFALLLPSSISAAHKNDTRQNVRHSKKADSGESAAKKAKARKTAVNKTATKKTTAKKETGKTAADSTERAIWLKRAQSSEVLSGKASWYGKDFHNKATASGLAYDMHTFTAAHRTLPMGTIIRVTDQNNGKDVMVCVTDRGPFIKGRIIDMSYAAAHEIGLDKRGVGKVQLEVVSDEHGTPLQKDQAYFVKYASASGKNRVGPFHAFADAAAMQEALRQAHPEAKVVLEKAGNR